MSYDTRFHAEVDGWTASRVMRTVFALTLTELVDVLHDTEAQACWPCPRCGAGEAFAVTVNTWWCQVCGAHGTAVDLALRAAVDPRIVEKLGALPMDAT